MDLFAIFSLAAVNGCAGQGSARCKQYRNPKGDIAVIAGLRRLGIVSNSRRLNGKLRCSRTGFGNNRQRVLADRQSFQIFSFQIDNGAAFLYCVVGSIQVFAVYLYLLEVFISCIGSKGKTVLCAFLPATVCPGCDDDLEIGSNRTADSTFAIVIAVAGGRNVCQILRICVGLAVKFNGCCISGYTCFRAGARGLFCRCYNYFRSFLMGFILFTSTSQTKVQGVPSVAGTKSQALSWV